MDKKTPNLSERTKASESTKNLLKRLCSYAEESRKVFYDRLGWACQVLNDTTWIADNFDGDDAAATKAIQDECFPELSQLFPLGHMQTLYRDYTVDVWERHDFNFVAMDTHDKAERAALRAKNKIKEEKKPTPRNYAHELRIRDRDLGKCREVIDEQKTSLDAMSQSLSKTQDELKKKAEDLKQVKRKNDDLQKHVQVAGQFKAENERLREENKQLKDKIRALTEENRKLKRENASLRKQLGE